MYNNPLILSYIDESNVFCKGLGASLVAAFVKKQYKVVLAARSVEKLQQIAKEINQPEQTFVVECDASSQSSIASCVQQSLQHLQTNTFDVVIFNAAYLARDKGYQHITEEDLNKAFAIKPIGTLYTAQAVLPLMQQHKKGTFLITGGGAGLFPVPILTTVGMNNAAARILAGNLDAQVKKDHVHVACMTICGMIEKKEGYYFHPDNLANLYVQTAEETDASKWNYDIILKQ